MQIDDQSNLRERFSSLYIQGSGIEIGALHNPLQVATTVSVKYIDYKSKAQNEKRYPELGDAYIVETNVIDNGFILASIADSSQDFIIANHVLEHAPDVHGTMLNWSKKLRRNGVLFIAVPIAEKCYDRGRLLTNLQHFQDDYDMYRQKNRELIIQKTREHLVEFISISDRNIRVDNNMKLTDTTPEAIQTRADKLIQRFDSEIRSPVELRYQNIINIHIHSINLIYDIHYHTFSLEAFERYLNYFVSSTGKCFKVLELGKNYDSEIIAVMQKLI